MASLNSLFGQTRSYNNTVSNNYNGSVPSFCEQPEDEYCGCFYSPGALDVNYQFGETIQICGSLSKSTINFFNRGRLQIWAGDSLTGTLLHEHIIAREDDNRFYFEYTLPTCSGIPLSSIYISIQTHRWVASNVGPFIGIFGTIRYLLGLKSTYVEDASKLLTVSAPISVPFPPKPIMEFMCNGGGQKTIEIPNPNGYQKLYLYEKKTIASDVRDLLSGNPDTILDESYLNNLADYVLDDQNGKFLFTRSYNESEVYYMMHGTPGACGLHISVPSPLGVVVLPGLSTPNLASFELEYCGSITDCDVATYNYLPLGPAPSNVLDQLNSQADNVETETQGQISISNTNISSSWQDENHITDVIINQSPPVVEQRICYNNLPETGSRNYYLNAEMNMSLTLENDLGEIEMDSAFSCNLGSIYAFSGSRALPKPKPVVDVICDSATSYTFECRDYVLGIEVWHNYQGNSPSNFVGGVTTSSAYPMTQGYPGIEKCDFDYNNNPYGNNVPSYRQRWSFSDGTFTSLRNGTMVYYYNYVYMNGERSGREPLALFAIPTLIPQPFEVELFKPNGTMPACTQPDTYHILEPSIAQVHTNDVNAALTSFNMTAQTIGLSLTFDENIEWQPIQHTTPHDSVRKVCRDNLPPGLGTCRTYQQNAILHFKTTYTNPCDSSVHSVQIPSCPMTLRETKVCKYIYPPEPLIKYVCDSMEQVCLSVPENYPAYRWKTVRPIGAGSNYNSIITSNCRDTNWVGMTEDSYENGNAAIFEVFSRVNGRESKIGSPVVILHPFIIDSMGIKQLPETRLLEPQFGDAYDPSSYCYNNQEPESFTDLSYSFNGYISALNDNVPPITVGNVQGTGSFSGELYWTDSNYLERMPITGAQRVCYSHLRPGYATFTDNKGRVYEAYLKAKTSVEIDVGNFVLHLGSDANSQYQNINFADTTITIENDCELMVAKKLVRKQEGIGEGCQQTNDPDQNDIVACDNLDQEKHLFDCMDSVLVIGPDPSVYENAAGVDSVTYQWHEPTYGPGAGALDSTSISNPTWKYSPHFDISQWIQYKCVITIYSAAGSETVNYCVFIYICPMCQTQIAQPNVFFIEKENCIYKIHPNPFTQEFHLEVLSPNDDVVLNKVIIYDQLGRKLTEQIEHSQKISIDGSSWVHGMYFVHVVDPEGKRQIIRLIK